MAISGSASGLLIALPQEGGWRMRRDGLWGLHLPRLSARWTQCDFRWESRAVTASDRLHSKVQREKTPAFLPRFPQTRGSHWLWIQSLPVSLPGAVRGQPSGQGSVGWSKVISLCLV